MRLTVRTPSALVLDAEKVTRLRARDATGELGVRPGHEDLLTVLATSVLDYTIDGEPTRYVAVAGGVLLVEEGQRAIVLTQEAVPGEDLHELETTVLRRLRERSRTEEGAAAGLTRLQVALARRLDDFVRRRGRPTSALAREVES